MPLWLISVCVWSSLNTPDSDAGLHALSEEPHPPASQRCGEVLVRVTHTHTPHSVLVAADLYVLGGTDSEEVFNDVWHLNLLSLAWTRLSLTLPKPLYFHDAAFTKVCPRMKASLLLQPDAACEGLDGRHRTLHQHLDLNA